MSIETTARNPIAFIGRLLPEEEQRWLDALNEAMPQERVVPGPAITDPARVELAIVADPDPSVVRRFGALSWVQSLWAGVESLLAETTLDHLPVVRMVDPELARTMAEAVLAWTLYLHREMPAYHAQQLAALWCQRPYVAPSRRRIGLLGVGVMGQAAARILRAAGFEVVGWSRTPSRIDGIATCSGSDGLAAMARLTDILVCLLPLTGSTRHLVGARVLRLLPRGASLINFGRGPVLRIEDLINALDAGHIAHAVLDVFEEEPLPAQSVLWRHPGITVLPHISAPTNPRTASLVVAANVRRWRETGRIPQEVDRRRGY